MVSVCPPVKKRKDFLDIFVQGKIQNLQMDLMGAVQKPNLQTTNLERTEKCILY